MTRVEGFENIPGALILLYRITAGGMSENNVSGGVARYH
jgi:hypothetical protein